MQPFENLESEIRKLIIEVLDLEDITPDDIDPVAPLFHEGLGLDSIDALDIALALEQRYGVHGTDDPEENARHFASVRSLATLVSAKRIR
jgi:acyl carrier protein